MIVLEPALPISSGGDQDHREAVVEAQCAIAQRLLADGLQVVIHSWSAHDAEQPWSHDSGEQRRVIEELGGLGARLDHIEADFADPDAPARVIDHAVDRFGAVDVLVANHAMSAPGRLNEISSADLDLAWAVNVIWPGR